MFAMDGIYLSFEKTFLKKNIIADTIRIRSNIGVIIEKQNPLKKQNIFFIKPFCFFLYYYFIFLDLILLSVFIFYNVF